MAPKLSRDDVLAVAALARLELTPAEIDQFSTQLARVLEFAGAIERADTAGVQPMTSPPTAATWRDDVPRPGLDRDAVLREAPAGDADAGLFSVPKVL
jgi:aspartyl-tRNA(Asn)/glutamyl-tRNA(Gln) amidotransferase subunit C